MKLACLWRGEYPQPAQSGHPRIPYTDGQPRFSGIFEPLERSLLEQQDELQVKDIMTLQPIILKPETSIMEAVSEMITRQTLYERS